MRILSHGTPFFCDYAPVDLYRGPHEVRTLGNFDRATYRYNPLAEEALDIITRIRQEWPADLLLCWMPEIHPPPVGVEQAPVPTVALVSDWNVFFPILETNLARYDIVLCDTAGTSALRSPLVTPHHLFPLYSQITPIHWPRPVARDIDVAFIGNLNHAAHPERALYLERLTRLADRYRVVITTEVYGEAYAHTLSRAHIVFNHSIRGEVNLRVLETMACGALAFLEESNLEIRSWFDPGRDLVLYNPDNFEDLLTHYLDHPGEARAIAERGRVRAAAYAGENRLTELIDRAADLPSGGRPFLKLPPEERLYQDVLMYGFSQWNVYRQLEMNLLPRLLSALPRDPRSWTVLGQHLANPHHQAETNGSRRERMLKAFVQAQRLAPRSAPYALNAASAFRACGMDSQEADYLNLTLLADDLDGAAGVIGAMGSPFRIRWHRAVAEKKASLPMLHAEARIRMASILARRGAPELAEENLLLARQLDPRNTGGILLLAEIQWAAGRLAEAVETLRGNLPNLPMDPVPRERLCEMLTHLGCREEAKALAETTLRIVETIRT